MQSLERHKRAWKRAVAYFFSNDGMAAAGNMAFLTMLSLFPFIIFLVAVAGFMGQTASGIEAVNLLLKDVLPPEVSKVIRGPIDGIVKNTGAEILTGSILLAIWTAGNGVEAAREVLIKAFGKEHARAIWIRRLESLGVVVFGAISIVLAMSIMVLGPAVLNAITSLFPDAMTDGITTTWGYLSLLVSPSILTLGIYMMFLALTPRKIKRASRLPGTLLSVVVLIATAKGLSVYLKYAGNYDVTYGSLAGVVVMQLFCFLVSLGFVLGAELNAAYTFGIVARAKAEERVAEQEAQKDTKKDSVEDTEAQGPDSADVRKGKPAKTEA